nr:MAG TPA: hypothetical protein [Caudoviricetes sp.]
MNLQFTGYEPFKTSVFNTTANIANNRVTTNKKTVFIKIRCLLCF